VCDVHVCVCFYVCVYVKFVCACVSVKCVYVKCMFVHCMYACVFVYMSVRMHVCMWGGFG